jgi:Fe2+ or Zn2+ uptake regulation protein
MKWLSLMSTQNQWLWASVARSENIEKLAGLLSADEYGEEIAEVLVAIMAEERKRNIFVVKLDEIKKIVSELDSEIKLSALETAVKKFIISKKQPLSAQEVSEELGAQYPSLGHRTHSSAILNSLVSKGQLGKIKVGYSVYFTEPREAVMECLKRRDEEPERASSVQIAAETGIPINVVLEVIGGLL